MCFSIDNNHKEVKIAKKDILCFKRLRKQNFEEKGLYSPCVAECYFESKSNSTVTKKVESFGLSGNAIHEGLHSYSTWIRANHFKDYYVHVYFAVIPKGTEYYYNPRNKEYVSLSLKVYRHKIFYFIEKLKLVKFK